MKTSYEYVRLRFDFMDLSELNRLSAAGWRVVAVEPMTEDNSSGVDRMSASSWALLEREI